MPINISSLENGEKGVEAQLNAGPFDDVPATQWFPEFEDPFFLAIEKEFYDIVNRYNALSNDPHSYNEFLEERMEAELNDLFTFYIMDIPDSYMDMDTDMDMD